MIIIAQYCHYHCVPLIHHIENDLEIHVYRGKSSFKYNLFSKVLNSQNCLLFVQIKSSESENIFVFIMMIY